MTPGLKWGRIALVAFLLEVVLFMVLVPIGLIFGSPGVTDAQGRPTDPTVFFIAVPVGCFVFGYLFGMWIAGRLSSQFALHGALVGIVATILYLGVCTLAPGGIPAVIASYGPFLFYLSQVLRIAGCTAGAVHQGTRQLRAGTAAA